MARINLLVMLIALALVSGISSPVQGFAEEPVCFDETGFCLRDSTVVEFFREHGAQEVLGYPISRPFLFRGATVQLFQRAGLEYEAGTAARPLNILGDDLLPLQHLLGATLPSFDNQVLQRAPREGSADFAEAAQKFLEAEVPNVYEGKSIGFLDAYRKADSTGRGIVASLELFGWPTSAPTRDPQPSGAVYQRFQRAIFRSSSNDRQAEPLLVGDYVKSLLTGANLPADLERDLIRSPMLRQYNPVAIDGLHRPWELPNTQLAGAFEREDANPRVILSSSRPGEPGDWPVDEPMAEISSEGYALRVDGPGSIDRGTALIASGGSVSSSFAMVADLQLAEGSLAGYSVILPRGTSAPPLALVIDARRGLATLIQQDLNIERVMWSWAALPSLRPPPEVNRWTIRAEKARLSAWVNGDRLFDLGIGNEIDGRLRLGVVTWGGPAKVIMSSFVVTAQR